MARNAGVAVAAAPVLAFTDDDTEVAPDWLRRALTRLAAEPQLAGLEGAVVASVDGPVDAVRARVVENRTGGAYLTANLVLRRAAFDAAGGFQRLRADGHPRWDIPFREDTDLALRVIERAGPIAFDPELQVRHPVDAVDLKGHLRTARFFEVDSAFARLHPGTLPPPWRAPAARLRTRSACLAVLALPLVPLTRAALLPLAAAVAVQHVQVERDLLRAGVERGAPRMAVDAVRRTPRAVLWALVAGSARLYGAASLALGRTPLRESSGT